MLDHPGRVVRALQKVVDGVHVERLDAPLDRQPQREDARHLGRKRLNEVHAARRAGRQQIARLWRGQDHAGLRPGGQPPDQRPQRGALAFPASWSTWSSTISVGSRLRHSITASSALYGDSPANCATCPAISRASVHAVIVTHSTPPG